MKIISVTKPEAAHDDKLKIHAADGDTGTVGVDGRTIYFTALCGQRYTVERHWDFRSRNKWEICQRCKNAVDRIDMAALLAAREKRAAVTIKTTYTTPASAREKIKELAKTQRDLAQSSRTQKGHNSHINYAFGLEHALEILNKIENENAEAIELLSSFRDGLPADHQDLPGAIRCIEILKYD